VACLLRDGPLAAALRALDVETHLVPTTRLRHVVTAAQAIRKIRDIVLQDDVDLVFGNMAMGYVYGGLASLGTRGRGVWFQHTIPSPVDTLGWFAASLPADRIYVNSQSTMKAQLRRLPITAGRVQLLYYGLDMRRFTPAEDATRPLSRELGIPEDAPIVAVIARLQRGKGQHIFLQAAAHVRRWWPRARFLVVGDTLFGLEPEYKAELRALADQLQLSEHVMFTGFRDDVPALLNGVDIVVHAATAPEAFGLAVAESLAMAKPVVATRGEGPAEIVEDGETGFLVSPGDAQALADKILLLLHDAGLRRRMGTKGRDMVLRRFTMERMIGELEESYLDVLRRGESGRGQSLS